MVKFIAILLLILCTDKLYYSVLGRNTKGAKPVPAGVSSGRPRLTKKISSSSQPKVQDQITSYKRVQSSLREKGNSPGNPIDIDAMFSLFKPSVVKEYVNILLSLMTFYSHFLPTGGEGREEVVEEVEVDEMVEASEERRSCA